MKWRTKVNVGVMQDYQQPGIRYLVEEFCRARKQIETHAQHVRKVKKQLETEIRDVKIHAASLEKQIIQYMEEHGHPGLEHNQCVIKLHAKKKYVSKAGREALVAEILTRHRISDPSVLTDLSGILGNGNGSRKGNNELRIVREKKKKS